MQSPIGTWAVVISTPIGKQHVTFVITTSDAGFVGTATQGTDTVSLEGVTWDGERLRWSQSITRPMRLRLAFDVLIRDDVMEGTAKAGVLPSSRVEGRRAKE